MIARRRGYTLLEMLTAFALLGTTWATIALTLHSLQRAERRMHDAFADANSIDRFSARLRADAHVSDAASIDASEDVPALILSQSGERRVRYRQLPEGIERSVLQAGEIAHRDVFHLADVDTRWLVDEENAVQMVQVHLHRTDVNPRAEVAQLVKAAVSTTTEPAAEVGGSES